MRHVEERAYLVLELVRRPVAAVGAAAREAVVREAARPHDFGARVVVFGLGHKYFRVPDNCAHERRGYAVGELHASAAAEPALHRVHEDVHAAAGRLVRGQGHRQLGVHDGEFRAAEVVAVAALRFGRFVGYDGGAAHFAAGRGYGEDGADGQTGARHADARVEAPYVAALFVCDAVGYRLRRVYNAASADGEDEVYAFAAAELYSFVDERKARVRHDAAELDEADASLAQRLAYPAEQPRALGAAAAVVEQRLFAAESGDERARLAFSAVSEHYLRRRVICEILYHRKFFPLARYSRRIFLPS